MRRQALLALAALGIGACGSSASPPSTGPVKRSPASKVVVVVMENEERSSVIGSPHAPYLTRLARTYATAPRSYAIRHPSLPNYLALVSGSTQGITNDCTSCEAHGTNLGDQLTAKGVSWAVLCGGAAEAVLHGRVLRALRQEARSVRLLAVDALRPPRVVRRAGQRPAPRDAAGIRARRAGPVPRHA